MTVTETAPYVRADLVAGRPNGRVNFERRASKAALFVLWGFEPLRTNGRRYHDDDRLNQLRRVTDVAR